MKALTVQQIEDARRKVLANAQALLADAELLFSNARYPRAFALAHLACEEIAKLPMLCRVGTEVARGKAVDWKRFRVRFQSHLQKLENLCTFDYLNSDVRPFDEDVREYEQALRAISERNDAKNAALYAGFQDSGASQPSEVITEPTAIKMITEAQRRVRAFEYLENATKGTLHLASNTPDFAEEILRLLKSTR